MNTLLNKVILLFTFSLSIILISTSSQATQKRSFTIYAFLPWTEHKNEDGSITSTPKLDDYLKQLNIVPVWVIYEGRYASLWDGQPTKQVKIIGVKKNTLVIDENKIKLIALDALNHPEIPVSFDTEFGDRFRPETVQPGVLEVIRLFKKYNNKNPVGVYAVAPQVDYAWQGNKYKDLYSKLNPHYQSVANAVDFLSPTIYYSYNPDLSNWKQAATYSLTAAQAYGVNKPVIPYLSFNYSDYSANGEQSAKERLNFLYQHGAAGCIVWGSSGEKTFFDRNSGWSKAMVDFAAAHK